MGTKGNTTSRKMTPQLKSGGLTELKSRLVFLLLGLVVFRIGAHVPVPGLDPKRLVDLFSGQASSIFGFLNMFSGGALTRLTVFALGIMPYITASIIIQMFSVVSPKLEQLKKEGESGRRKLSQYTRYSTLLLATFQAVGMSKWLVAKNIALYAGFGFYLVAVVTLVTGTMFLMWLGEQITEYGVGNGISMIIFAGIVSSLPGAVAGLVQQFKEGQLQGLSFFTILFVIAAVVTFVVFVERGQRRIKVSYAQRQRTRVGGYSAQTTHLPFKINMAGVIPPIFASSIVLLPATIAQFFAASEGFSWLSDIALLLSPGQPLYMLCLSIAIIAFAFFYTALVFNPKDTADNLKRSGAFIQGIRPGDQTARYIDAVMSRLTLVGALYLIIVSLLPEFMRLTWHVTFNFGGTSLLIIVVVVMDFIAQIQSHLMSHQYESLMRKASMKTQGSSRSGFLR